MFLRQPFTVAHTHRLFPPPKHFTAWPWAPALREGRAMMMSLQTHIDSQIEFSIQAPPLVLTLRHTSHRRRHSPQNTVIKGTFPQVCWQQAHLETQPASSDAAWVSSGKKSSSYRSVLPRWPHVFKVNIQLTLLAYCMEWIEGNVKCITRFCFPFSFKSQVICFQGMKRCSQQASPGTDTQFSKQHVETCLANSDTQVPKHSLSCSSFICGGTFEVFLQLFQ